MDTLNDIISELKWGNLNPIKAHYRIETLIKKEKKELLSALKDANTLLAKHVEEHELDNPTYWNITEVLKRNGIKTSRLDV